MLALRWDDLDSRDRTLRIDESLVAVNRGAVLGDAKNARSRRLVPLSTETVRVLNRRRADQAEERLLAGPDWEDNDLIISTCHGRHVLPPRAYDRSLALLVEKAEIPRLTSHDVRHTWSTTPKTSTNAG